MFGLKASATWVMLLLLASQGACEWLWPRNHPAEKTRCRCSRNEICGEDGQCMPSADGRVPTDAGPADRGERQDCTPGAGFIPGSWKEIPAGTFVMGSPGPNDAGVEPEPCRGDNEDEHVVELTHRFFMQTTEVQQDDYQAKMGSNPSFVKSCGGDCPVETVSWHEAAAYCNSLSATSCLEKCYQCGPDPKGVMKCVEAPAYADTGIYRCPGYRLPTEAEWEYAYRARTSTAYYNGTNDPALCETCTADPGVEDVNLSAIAWYCLNSTQKTDPSKGKLKNGWELYDMAGNVGEWCHDRYKANLGVKPVKDPVEAASSSDDNRVLRNGGARSKASRLRAAYREGRPADDRNYYMGFRCARTLLP